MELVRQNRLVSHLNLQQTKIEDSSNSIDNKNSSKGISNPAFCPDAENPDDASDDGNKYETIQTFPSKSSSHETSQKQQEKRNGKDYRGLALALFSSVCFSLVVLIVKVLSRDYGVDPYGASFWRFTGTILPTVPIFLYFEFCSGGKRDNSTLHTLLPIRAKWETWVMLLSCGVIGSTSVILRYHALRYLTIADTLVITYAAPVLVTLLAHCFLGERCGVFPVIVAIGTFLGVVIVAKPPLLTGAAEFDSGSMLGTGFACGSLLCVTLSTIATRKLREVHFTVTIIVLGIIGVSQALIMTYFSSSAHFNFPTQKNDSCLIAALAGLSFLAQFAWITALKFEDAGPISLIRCCDVIFGFIFQYAFLSVTPDIFSSVGAAIVISGVLLTGFRKWLSSLSPEDNRRKRYWLILI